MAARDKINARPQEKFPSQCRAARPPATRRVRTLAFHRIRYFEFMVNGGRAEKLASCHALLGDEETGAAPAASPLLSAYKDAVDAKRVRPDCSGGRCHVRRLPDLAAGSYPPG
jgi:hypothetical protein